jgi:hypothetical protein
MITQSTQLTPLAVAISRFSGLDITTGVLSTSGASYTISTNGSTILAINGQTGAMDYSGSDAVTVIQNALDTLNAQGGGTALLKAGTYPLTRTLWERDNVELIGESRDSVVLQAQFSTQDAAVVRMLGISNCAIRHLKILGNDALMHSEGKAVEISGVSTNITLEDIWVQSCSYGIISDYSSGDHVTGLEVKSCFVIDNSAHGIWLQMAYNARVHQNELHGTGSYGIQVIGQQIEVDGNVLVDCATGNDWVASIAVYNPLNRTAGTDTKGVSIHDNTIRYTANPAKLTIGILVSGENIGGPTTQGITVTGNTIIGAGSSTNCLNGLHLEHDMIENVATVSDVVFQGNTVNGFLRGIAVAGGEAITTERNTLDDVKMGIYASAAGRHRIVGNILHGATKTVAGNDGISLGLTEGYQDAQQTISENTIDNFYTGINEAQTETYNGDNNIIENNELTNIGAGGAVNKKGTHTVIRRKIQLSARP